MKAYGLTSNRSVLARVAWIALLAAIWAQTSCDTAGSSVDRRAPTPSRDKSRAEGVDHATDADDDSLAKAADAPVVGHFRLRDRVITVHSSAAGPLFSVAMPDGEVVENALTAHQLEARHPELWESVRAAVAEGDETTPARRYLDASVFGRDPTGPELPDPDPPPIALPPDLGR